MKKWPNEKTNMQGVSPRTLDEWYYWQRRVAMTVKTLEWLKLQGTFPEGQTNLQRELDSEQRECELNRLRCRRQDIITRWYSRKWLRPIPAKRTNSWQPTPMLIDDYLDRHGQIIHG